MTKPELLEQLSTLAEGRDPESDHRKADEALLDYINDPEIREAYDNIEAWYA